MNHKNHKKTMLPIWDSMVFVFLSSKYYSDDGSFHANLLSSCNCGMAQDRAALHSLAFSSTPFLFCPLGEDTQI